VDILTALEWRYATKAMNGKKISQEQLDVILKSINLAPTSLGLQPFDVILVSDDELKRKILPIANNQKQIIDCSNLLIFAAWTEFTDERKQRYYDDMKKIRGFVPEPLINYIESVYENARKNKEWFLQWAQKQAYIAFGVAIVAAASIGVDSTPMEGFDPIKLDELLQLNEKKLTSTLLLPLGFRDIENDYLVKLPKVRRELGDIIIKLAASVTDDTTRQRNRNKKQKKQTILTGYKRTGNDIHNGQRVSRHSLPTLLYFLFSPPHIFFNSILCQRTNGTLAFAPTAQANPQAKAKEPFFANAPMRLLKII